VTPPSQMLGPVAWRERSVAVQGREWSFRQAGDGEVVLALDPPGRSGADGPFQQLTDGYRLIETTLVDYDDGAADAPPARATAGLVRQFLAAAGVDHCAVLSRGAATSVALWLAIDEPGTVTALVLESPPLLIEDAALGDRCEAELLHALSALEVPTLVLLGESVEAGTFERLSTYKRLPASTIGLVYGAGEDVRGDRPGPYASAVTEYLERGQAFVVSRRSTVIHP
jgi:hypothetical protein